jgi:probable HAF family extracellular repeat protein
MRVATAIVAALIAAAADRSPAHASGSRCQLRYEVVDPGTLGGRQTAAYAVSNGGAVVGFSEALVPTPDGGEEVRDQAFRWRRGEMGALEPVAAQGSVASDVNDRGDAAGTWCSAECRAVVWRRATGGMVDLGTPGAAEAINERGQVAGTADGPAGLSQAFRWDGGQLRFLGTLGGPTSFALGINRRGSVVGLAERPDPGRFHAFLWKRGVLRDLGTLGGTLSHARSVNDHHVVVGGSRAADGRDRPFVWHAGVMRDLGTLEGDVHGDAFSVNHWNQIVGVSSDGDLRFRAVLWHHGRILDLNQLVPPDSGWVLSEAYDINDRGWIVGSGARDGRARPFLLKPTLSCPR